MASHPILPVELDTILNPEFRDINSKRPGHGCQQAHLTSVLMAGYYDKDGAGTFRELRLRHNSHMQAHAGTASPNSWS
jgi:hypothetical protein